jgi:hypothetical protein
LKKLKSQVADVVKGDVDGEIVSVSVMRVGAVMPVVDNNDDDDDCMIVDGDNDSSLIMNNLKKQNEKIKNSKGFTTRNMREVQRLKNNKVYKHASIKIILPDRTSVNVVIKVGTNSTAGVIRDVINDVISRTFIPELHNVTYRMYVTPPKRNIDLDATFKGEGLVPTSSVYFALDGYESGGADWILSTVENGIAVVPEGVKVGSGIEKKAVSNGSVLKAVGAEKPAKKKETEEEMMKRMMSGKKKVVKK